MRESERCALVLIARRMRSRTSGTVRAATRALNSSTVAQINANTFGADIELDWRALIISKTTTATGTTKERSNNFDRFGHQENGVFSLLAQAQHNGRTFVPRAQARRTQAASGG